MNELVGILNQPLPIGLILMIGIVVLWFRLSDLKRSVDNVKLNCRKQLLWCIDHFKGEAAKGGMKP